MERPTRYLTKSLVRKALSCPRKLFYSANPDVYPQNQIHTQDSMLTYLSEEGRRFEAYCRGLFPHGIEIRPNNMFITGKTAKGVNYFLDFNSTDDDSMALESNMSLADELVGKTKHLLMKKSLEHTHEQRVTLFEGAITHGPFFARPDILDKIFIPTEGNFTNPSSNENRSQKGRVELRVIEIKSKGWDSRYSQQKKMWSADKKSIKSSYLPYIQDVAFQTMVARLAFPQYHVTSWLMMPDRAKKMSKDNPIFLTDKQCRLSQPTLQETEKSIDDSVAAFLNVDDLVEVALTSNVTLPGSNMHSTLKEVVEQWAEQINDENFGLKSFSPSIGTHCGSCEYRLKMPLADSSSHDCNNDKNDHISGFDLCWMEATGNKKNTLKEHPPIIDLYGYSKKLIQKFASEGKYTFSDLSASDFGLQDDGDPFEKNYSYSSKQNNSKKKIGSSNTIHGLQRQWFQVSTSQRIKIDPSLELAPNYIIRQKPLLQEMQKWQYPLHFVDFETSTPALPYYNGSAPYDLYAFQFSHHVMVENNGSLEVHHASEFLHSEVGSCPNEAFLSVLANALGDVPIDGGSVFCWAAHEGTVLSSLLSSPEYSSSLSPSERSVLSALLRNGSHPMIDLCKLAKDYFYVDGSDGSSSIKKLLAPTLQASERLKRIYGTPSYNGHNFKNFQWYHTNNAGKVIDPYEILSKFNSEKSNGGDSVERTVAHGGAAASAFRELQCNVDLSEHERKVIESSLLRYCELDTLAMAMIVQAWQGFLSDE